MSITVHLALHSRFLTSRCRYSLSTSFTCASLFSVALCSQTQELTRPLPLSFPTGVFPVPSPSTDLSCAQQPEDNSKTQIGSRHSHLKPFNIIHPLQLKVPNFFSWRTTLHEPFQLLSFQPPMQIHGSHGIPCTPVHPCLPSWPKCSSRFSQA